MHSLHLNKSLSDAPAGLGCSDIIYIILCTIHVLTSPIKNITISDVCKRLGTALCMARRVLISIDETRKRRRQKSCEGSEAAAGNISATASGAYQNISKTSVSLQRAVVAGKESADARILLSSRFMQIFVWKNSISKRAGEREARLRRVAERARSPRFFPPASKTSVTTLLVWIESFFMLQAT